MTLDEIPEASAVFVDANIFVYHFTGVSRECRSLLERSERREIRVITGTHLLLEVLHRLMMIEAVTKGFISTGQPVKRLKKQWKIIQQLRDYERSVTEIESFHVEILPVTIDIIRASAQIRRTHGLMTNDSITVAMMLHHRITRLITFDSDLERVPQLEMFQPTDIR